MLKYSLKDATREQFLQYRAGCIGSSDIATIIGVSPWQTPIALWMKLTGKVANVEQETRALRLGIAKEDLVAQEWEHETGGKARKALEIHCIDSEPRFIASPDYYVGEDTILECKTTKASNFYSYQDEIPAHVMAQVQWQMGIIGKHKGIVACLSGDNDFVVHAVDFDPVFFADMVKRAKEFLRYVDDPSLGAPAAMAGDAKLLAIAIPSVPNTTKDITEARGHIEELKKLQSQIKLASEQVDYYKALIRQALGTAEIGMIDGKKAVSAKLQTRAEYVCKASTFEMFRVF